MSWLPLAGCCASLVLYPLLSSYYRRHPLRRTILPPLPRLKVHSSAHRGGACERPENTLAAFHHSDALDIDLFELDVHLTKDGQVVVYHDQTVDRCAEGGVTGAVEDFTYADLPSHHRTHLPLPPPFHTPGHCLSWTPSPDATATELEEAYRPPLLEEVFRRFPHRCINIDLKKAGPQLIDKVAELIHKYKRADRTIWGASNESSAQVMLARHPEIPLFFSAGATLKLVALHVTGLLPFVRMEQRALEIPFLSPHLLKRMGEHGGEQAGGFKGWMFRYIAALFGRVLSSPRLLQHLQARNIKVIYWVLNEEEEFQQAFDLGADGVMTDRPTRLREFIQRRNKQQEQAEEEQTRASPDTKGNGEQEGVRQRK